MDEVLRKLTATQTSTAGTQEDEEPRLQRDLDKKCDNILSQKLSKFNTQKPTYWILEVQQLLQANRLAWILDEDNDIECLTSKMRETVDAAIVAIVVKSLTPQARARLPTELRQMTVAHVLEIIEDKFVDKSESKQEALREVAKKIRMRRNRTVEEYVTKHRILGQDMKYAGFRAFVNEKGEITTINHIINGIKGNNIWSPFRLAITTTKKETKPGTIVELEEMMTNYERALDSDNENQRETHRWKFSNHIGNHARNHERATKWRKQVHKDASDGEMHKTKKTQEATSPAISEQRTRP